MHGYRSLAVALTLLASAWCQAGFASFAGLDPTFGTGGIASGGPGAGAMFVDSMDRIYLMSRSHPNYLVGRYLANGALDDTFGNSGFVLVQPWATSVEFTTFAYDEDSDTIIMAGYEQVVGAPTSTVARFDLNGDLVTSFGPGATGHIDITDDAFFYGVHILPDGSIVAAGEYYASVSGATGIERDVVVSRLSSTGTPDASFGSSGTKILSLGAHCEAVRTVQTDASSRILVGLSIGAECDVADAAVARLTVDGSLDTTFSGDGIAMLGIDNPAVPRLIRVQAGGDVVALSAESSDDPYTETDRLTVTQLATDGSSVAKASSGLPSAVDGVLGKVPFGVQSEGKLVGAGVVVVNCCEQLRLYRLEGCDQLTPAGGACVGSDGGGGGGAFDPWALAVLLIGLRRRVSRRAASRAPGGGSCPFSRRARGRA